MKKALILCFVLVSCTKQPMPCFEKEDNLFVNITKSDGKTESLDVKYDKENEVVGIKAVDFKKILAIIDEEIAKNKANEKKGL